MGATLARVNTKEPIEMRRSGDTIRAGYILMATMMALLTLAACAPVGVEPPAPPRSALATATAAANATVQAGGSAGASATPLTLPQPTVDPGWVAVVRITDGSKLGGPSVVGGPTGGATASSTLMLGVFKLSSAAQVAIMFGCVSPATTRATLEIGVSGESSTIQCGSANSSMNRSQFDLPPTEVGRTLTVTATIATDGQPPQWYALVEQPK